MRFDPATSQYFDDNGNVVTRDRLLGILNRSAEELTARLERIASQLAQGNTTIQGFSQAVRRELKPVVVQMALLGSGGINGTTQQAYGAAGHQLRQAYAALDRLNDQLANGELTLGQAIDRTRRLALHSRQAFSRSEQISMGRAGYNQAWRRLDPASDHCPDCPAYETGGWVPISEVVPVGSACRCGGRCRCSIVFRRDPATLLNQNLADQVLKSQIDRSNQRDEPTVRQVEQLVRRRGRRRRRGAVGFG